MSILHDGVVLGLLYFTRTCHCTIPVPPPSILSTMSESSSLTHHSGVLRFQICKLAPKFPPSKLHFVRDMMMSQSLTTSKMAEEAKCS
jgi:hypothetical protein